MSPPITLHFFTSQYNFSKAFPWLPAQFLHISPFLNPKIAGRGPQPPQSLHLHFCLLEVPAGSALSQLLRHVRDTSLLGRVASLSPTLDSMPSEQGRCLLHSVSEQPAVCESHWNPRGNELMNTSILSGGRSGFQCLRDDKL